MKQKTRNIVEAVMPIINAIDDAESIRLYDMLLADKLRRTEYSSSADEENLVKLDFGFKVEIETENGTIILDNCADYLHFFEHQNDDFEIVSLTIIEPNKEQRISFFKNLPLSSKIEVLLLSIPQNKMYELQEKYTKNNVSRKGNVSTRNDRLHAAHWWQQPKKAVDIILAARILS